MTRVSLTPLEIASGLPLAPRQTPPDELPPPRRGTSPADLLGELLLPALQRTPCVVSFSGGRDSSAVLAVATYTARRHGLPDPVPLSLRFPGATRTNEDEWQERIVGHLGIADWQRQELGDELDVVGPCAQVLLRSGRVRFPSNLHFLVPALELARGGSVLTGVGGDEMFQQWPYARSVLFRAMRQEPTRVIARTLALLLLPLPLRRAVNRRQGSMRLPWLTPLARAEVVDWWAGRQSAYVPTYQQALHRSLAGRMRELQESARVELSRQFDVDLVHAFTLLEFTSRVTADLPSTGFRSRAAAMDGLFGHLLPQDLVRREMKAVMTDIFWGRYARAFAREWDGYGVDEDLVDVDALREVWSRSRPHFRSWLLAQHLWAQRAARPGGAGPSD